jgi:hypothetical protein
VAGRGWPAVVAAHERIARHLERPPAEYRAAARQLRLAAKAALEDGDVERRPSD